MQVDQGRAMALDTARMQQRIEVGCRACQNDADDWPNSHIIPCVELPGNARVEAVDEAVELHQPTHARDELISECLVHRTEQLLSCILFDFVWLI